MDAIALTFYIIQTVLITLISIFLILLYKHFIIYNVTFEEKARIFS